MYTPSLPSTVADVTQAPHAIRKRNFLAAYEFRCYTAAAILHPFVNLPLG